MRRPCPHTCPHAWLVAGCPHPPLPSPVPHKAFFASRYLGQLNLTCDASGRLTAYSGQPQLLGGAVSGPSSNVGRDASMLSLIAQFSGQLTTLNSAVLGEPPPGRAGICPRLGWPCRRGGAT